MASKRIATALVRSAAAVSLSQAAKPRLLLYPFQGIRHRSCPASGSKPTIYRFEDIKSLSSSPSPSRILIDVREPSEFGAGAIPTAINLPVTSAPEALSLPADEFEDRFGFAKPDDDKELVFYCRSGVRSSGAAQLALQNGYGKVGEYRGSWLDWEKNLGEGS